MRAVVLDAWAVLALLRGERPALDVMTRYVNQAEAGRAKLGMNIVNLGEVLYRLIQLEGMVEAKKHVSRFRAGPVDILPAREDVVVEAAELKAEYAISYADAFAVATARRQKAMLLTGDPEILALPHAIVRTHALTRN
jgi:predicted nucleic acid-binding protein